MRLKEEIYNFIKQKNTALDEGITAHEVAEKFNISRNTASHYLNRLADDLKLSKSLNRPVKYKIKESSISEQSFSVIGEKGSLKSAIQSSKAAVSYPPKGLSILLKGDSGVGKSFLVKFIFQYCVEQKLISSEKKLYILNCADYANNPELLSANLFGYKKGAFTGAEKDMPGLLEKANDSLLFLDEIHRLSVENQEKLFLFMDSGKFSRLGSSGEELSSDVRLLFATTEKIENSLLTTFRRRIPLKVEIPNYQNRPYLEKLELIFSFFQIEQAILKKDIKVSEKVIDYLLNGKFEGNVGEVQNTIKLLCANGYKENKNSEIIIINKLNEGNLSDIEDKKDFYLISNNLEIQTVKDKFALVFDELDVSIGNTKLIKKELKAFLNQFEKMKHLQEFDSIIYQNILNKVIDFSVVSEQSYGFKLSKNSTEKIANLIYYMTESQKKILDLETIRTIQKENSKSYYFVNKIYNQSMLADLEEQKEEILIFLTLLFTEKYIVEERIPVVLMAHGQSTAKSIGSTINRLLDEFLFEMIDLDLESTVDDIINNLKEYLHAIDTKEGLIFIVDMGSLEQLYEPLKKFISGDLLLVNYLSTPLALDVGLKIQSGLSINQLTKKIENKHKIELKSYEGFAKGANIIISCISGIGIAMKLKDILSSYFEGTEIITMDYQHLINSLEHEKEYFEQTKFILTTTSIYDNEVDVINIEDLISSTTANEKILSIIGDSNYGKLSAELINFFSIEGAGTRLSFLNPEVIISEMSDFIVKIESYFMIEFQNFLKMNLLMHLSIMIERIIQGNQMLNVQQSVSEEEKKFVKYIQDNSKKIEKKYNIDIPEDEILLIYQIIKNVL